MAKYTSTVTRAKHIALQQQTNRDKTQIMQGRQKCWGKKCSIIFIILIVINQLEYWSFPFKLMFWAKQSVDFLKPSGSWACSAILYCANCYHVLPDSFSTHNRSAEGCETILSLLWSFFYYLELGRYSILIISLVSLRNCIWCLAKFNTEKTLTNGLYFFNNTLAIKIALCKVKLLS